MKVLQSIVEVPLEGMTLLLGKKIILLCANYIYAGELVGVNETCLKLATPHIVYETGPWTGTKFKDCQPLAMEFLYIQLEFVESFGETTKL